MLGIRYFKNKAIDFWQGDANLFYSDIYLVDADLTSHFDSKDSLIALPLPKTFSDELGLESSIKNWCKQGFQALNTKSARHLSIVDPQVNLDASLRAQTILRQLHLAISQDNLSVSRITIIVSNDENYSTFMNEINDIFPDHPHR